MGRHSKPGPGESFGEPAEPADSSESPTGRFAQQPDDAPFEHYEPLDDRYLPDDEPDYRDEYDSEYSDNPADSYGGTPPPPRPPVDGGAAAGKAAIAAKADGAG